MVSRSFPLEGVTEQYFYDPSGKRVGKLRTVGTNQPSAFIYLYDQAGGRTTKECPVYSYLCNRATDDVYFAGKLVITQRGKAVVTDRLGTVRADFSDEPDPPPTPPPPTPLSYLPYGEGQNPPTGAGSQVRFATYTRDSTLSNQDYADQRYYSPWLGRFNTADRMTASNALVIPANWNKYAYVGGDPINKTDPRGMCSPEDDPPCFSATGTAGGGGGAGLDALNGWGGGLGDLGSTAEEVDIGDQRYGGAQEVARKDWCDKNDPTNAKVINYIESYQGAATAAAAATGLSADLILAWGGYESNYGTGPVATGNNNFLGLTNGGWSGTDACPANAVNGFVCFSPTQNGLLASATSALTSFNGKYLNAALVAQNAGASVGGIAQAIANAGFNSEYAAGVYGGKVADSYDAIEHRKNCP